MKRFLDEVRRITISGFFAFFPLYVLFAIITNGLGSLATLGSRIAGMFGLKSVLGVGGRTVISGCLIIAIWIISGLLIRVSFVGAMSRSVEKMLSKYIPGYSTYKQMAEEKLGHRVRILPYASALVELGDYWGPGYVVEEDPGGNCVVFLPEIPETSKGRILLARKDQIRFISSVTANELDAILKKMGKGLLAVHPGPVETRGSISGAVAMHETGKNPPTISALT